MTFTSNDKGSEQLAIKGYLPADYVYYDQIAGDYVFTFQMQESEESKKLVDVSCPVVCLFHINVLKFRLSPICCQLTS